MKALTKEKMLIMINAIYKNDNDVVYEDYLKRLIETYGDDYYINRDYGKFELVEKNKNWRDN